jgi:hypothetical protein
MYVLLAQIKIVWNVVQWEHVPHVTHPRKKKLKEESLFYLCFFFFSILKQDSLKQVIASPVVVQDSTEIRAIGSVKLVQMLTASHVGLE